MQSKFKMQPIDSEIIQRLEECTMLSRNILANTTSKTRDIMAQYMLFSI